MVKREMSGRELYWRLLSHVRPYWKQFSLSIIAMVVVALSEPAFPALLKPMLDGSFVSKDHTFIKWVPVLLIVLFFVRGLATYVSQVSINWVANKLVMDLRDLMFRKLITLPTQYYDTSSSGSLIANIAFNVTQVTTAATNVITVLVRDSLTIIGLLAWMLYLNWKLTLIALAATPIITLIVKTVSKRLRNMSRHVQQSMGDITHVLEESIGGHKVIKVFGGQKYEARRFFDAINASRLYSTKQLMASAANVPIVQFVAAIALAIIVFIATLQSASNQTTVGGFVSFITAMLMLFAPLKRLTSINESIQRGLAAAENVFQLIDQESEPNTGTHSIKRARGALEFKQVSFWYNDSDQLVLKNIELKIEPGETIALVGPSGSGKTTLVNLIPRFYHPSRGRILLDGIDTGDLDLANLRSNIALVSQDVVLFNDTIAANIAYGLPKEIPEADIIAAAEAAHAMEYIQQIPGGLNGQIGERGIRLSGGQRQRLAIARALLKNAPILILDEATSSLDTQSERHVQAALETLMQGRTTIIIAHRLSTIENADRIVVMQKGSIVEIGPHNELLASNGAYATLYRIQFALNQAELATTAKVI